MQADAIDEIVAILAAQHKSWPRAGGWAPSNASALLEVARLDRQLSFAHTLRDNFVPFPKESADARQILGYVTLRSLCEGAIQLFITVYYNDYIADKEPITRRNRKKIVDPEDAQLSDLIEFYVRHGDPAFESFLARVKTRGNAIHHFREREIGTQDELKADIVLLRDFLASVDKSASRPTARSRSRLVNRAPRDSE